MFIGTLHKCSSYFLFLGIWLNRNDLPFLKLGVSMQLLLANETWVKTWVYNFKVALRANRQFATFLLSYLSDHRSIQWSRPSISPGLQVSIMSRIPLPVFNEYVACVTEWTSVVFNHCDILIVLLRYNLHTTKFSCLKCTVQYFSVSL